MTCQELKLKNYLCSVQSGNLVKLSRRNYGDNINNLETRGKSITWSLEEEKYNY
jgi:hypothetical protein